MFVYTKNEEACKELEKAGSKLLKTQEDGTKVYSPPPVQQFNFKQYEDTYLSNKFTF